MSAETVLLGVLQGATEFLPVSSSGHLALAKILFGFENSSIAYDLVLHLATVLATLIYFAKDIGVLFVEWINGFFNRNARRWEGWRYGWAVILATAVTAAIGLPMKDRVIDASQNSLMVSIGLLVTGTILVLSRFIPVRKKRVGLLSGLMCGAVQGIATLPGISRSGSTIVAGMASGLAPQEAFKFSFLMSIPAIVGANVVEVFSFGGITAFAVELPPGWISGFCAAFLTGIVSLALLRRVAMFGFWWMFGIYCLLLGGGVTILTYMGIY